MIKESFVFLEKCSIKKESSFRKQGLTNWQEFLASEKVKGIAAAKKEFYNRKIREAQQALSEDNAGYFVGKLPAKEMWRLYPQFKEDCCFLDIETDSYGKITVVGISNYYNTNTFVQGFNLEKNLLEKELAKYKLLVTFNGSSFDLPKLKKQLQLEVKMPHIDLKPLCVKLDLKGGLKEVERILNLKRPAHLYGNPVELWKAFHASGDREYLELLIDYNKEDIENLKGVMNHVYRKMREKVFI
ncbi:MAG TPA: ribonuclease H-like domain-containing protein [Candidatus Nanoarchaeia archaeon]|nr:ribonuclease H-like domain-containing protein [Candidatus Nanoarchaeia archaeon]